MDYKHRRRKAPAMQYTPTYYGDGLELQLERQDPLAAEREAYQAPYTKGAAVSGKEREGVKACVVHGGEAGMGLGVGVRVMRMELLE